MAAVGRNFFVWLDQMIRNYLKTTVKFLRVGDTTHSEHRCLGFSQIRL